MEVGTCLLVLITGVLNPGRVPETERLATVSGSMDEQTDAWMNEWMDGAGIGQLGGIVERALVPGQKAQLKFLSFQLPE